MNRSKNVDRKWVGSWRKFIGLAEEDAHEIQSLDDIPDFDDPKAEKRYWETHRLSQAALDELPPDEYEEAS
jgi:hypothetical protein